MKTKLLFIGFVLTTFCNAQIINFPDSNFKAKLLSASATTAVATHHLSTYNPTGDYWTPNFSPYYTAVDQNGDGEIQVSEAQLVKGLLLSSSNITDLTGIEYFTNLQFLKCSHNQIQNLNLSAANTMEYLNCDYNQMASLTISGLAGLRTLMCAYNQLTTINTGTAPQLRLFNCAYNNITALNLNVNIHLQTLNCGGNELTVLDLSTIHFLQGLYCSNNHLTSLDMGSNPFLQGVFADYNDLTYLNLKCGNNTFNNYLQFNYNPNLQFVCFDEEDLNLVTARLLSYGYTNCVANTYCSFTPGGNYNTITGTVSLDIDNNGCDANDIHKPNVRIDVTDISGTAATFTNQNGVYTIYALPGSVFTITPQIPDINYYTLSPASANLTINGSNQTITQNFCITANGTHNDLEILLLPRNHARPGIDGRYKLRYINKGNTTQSGTVTFTYDDAVSDLVSSTPTAANQSTGSLSWNFANLQPFESRDINITLNLNSPTETPALIGGDVVYYTASVMGQADETPDNNTASLHQVLVNSFDPNDKTCMEGTVISSDKVGEYVHYLIRFENTGTASAQNIVVKDMIDTTKFDVLTLATIDTSHNCVTRISNTNKVEFIFENINLPFDDANNDGYVFFKIKTLPNLVVGDTFSNLANIYFDYNFPIVTNNYTTTVQVLGVAESDATNTIVAYPNPVQNTLHFQSNDTVLKVEVYDIAGRILCSKSVIATTIDLSDLKTGTYILNIYTEKGVTKTKIVKE